MHSIIINVGQFRDFEIIQKEFLEINTTTIYFPVLGQSRRIMCLRDDQDLKLRILLIRICVRTCLDTTTCRNPVNLLSTLQNLSKCLNTIADQFFSASKKKGWICSKSDRVLSNVKQDTCGVIYFLLCPA